MNPAAENEVDKSPDAFRTISEVSEDLDLPQHVLRFWETRFSQIKPLKRGGGRRYYRPDDVELLRGIRHLLYGEGYTIKGVQRILKEEGLRFVQTIWKEAPAPVPLGPAAPTSSGGMPVAPVEPIEDTPQPPARPVPRSGGGEPAPRPVTAQPVVSPAPARPHPAPDALRALQSALFELGECRRLLAGARAGDSGGE